MYWARLADLASGTTIPFRFSLVAVFRERDRCPIGAASDMPVPTGTTEVMRRLRLRVRRGVSVRVYAITGQDAVAGTGTPP
jgi:hypothetical protein